MKKEYNKPALEVVHVNLYTVICGSGSSPLTLSIGDPEDEDKPTLTETNWGTGFFSE